MTKACSSCNKHVVHDFTEFKCPKCNSKIIRCMHCRGQAITFKCECGFELP